MRFSTHKCHCHCACAVNNSAKQRQTAPKWPVAVWRRSRLAALQRTMTSGNVKIISTPATTLLPPLLFAMSNGSRIFVSYYRWHRWLAYCMLHGCKVPAQKCTATIKNEIVGQSSLHVRCVAAVDCCFSALSAVVACDLPQLPHLPKYALRWAAGWNYPF